MSAFRGKAYIAIALHMSADRKRTGEGHIPIFLRSFYPDAHFAFMLLETGNYFAVARSNAGAHSLGVGLTQSKGGFGRLG